MNQKLGCPPEELQLSVLIPCFQEEENISELIARVCDVMQKEEISWEAVLVDDASPDATWREIQKFVHLDSHIQGARHVSNRGIVAAWQTALGKASGNWVVTLDADLQYAPEDISKLIRAMQEGEYDLVQGIRARRFEKPRYRIILSVLFSKILEILFHLPFEDVKSGFVLYKKDVFSEILKHQASFRLFQHWIIVAAYHMGFRVRQIPITFCNRRAGKSFISSPFGFAFKAFWEIPRAFFYFRALKRRSN